MEEGNFIFLTSFVILDLEEDVDHILILGMPFIYVTKAIIDVGTIKLQIGEESQTFNAYQEPQDEDIRIKIEVMNDYELKDKEYIKAKVKRAKVKEYNFKAQDNEGGNSIKPIEDIK